MVDSSTPPASSDSMAARPPAKRRLKRWSLWIGIALVSIVIGTELYARFYLGLGDPPLMMNDPKIEYLYQPNQTCRRFGNTIHYNRWSMRADDFGPVKSTPDELRVMVIGDSVINGGSQTDQSQLATALLQRELATKLRRSVVVGNISAGSWGPPNEMEYLKRYGLFAADVLIIEESSHDVVDVPTFEASVGARADMPAVRPFSATSEAFFRYFLPKLHLRAVQLGDLPAPPSDTLDPNDVAICLGDLREMIRMGQAIGARVIVVQHLEYLECKDGKLKPGHDLIRDAASDAGAEVVQLGPAMKAAIDRGEQPYRDGIHPNPLGQRLMADTLEATLLGQPTSNPTTRSTTRQAATNATRGE